MEKYIFSPASFDDIPEIVSIYNSLVGTSGCTWDYDYPNRKTAESDIKNKGLYLLKKTDKIIAVASVGEFNELNGLNRTLKKPCELARIGVIPTMQKQGIGTIMLKNIIDTAREKGYDGITLLVSKTNPAALALYEKSGFERFEEVFRFGIDFYYYQMKFNLTK